MRAFDGAIFSSLVTAARREDQGCQAYGRMREGQYRRRPGEPRDPYSVKLQLKTGADAGHTTNAGGYGSRRSPGRLAESVREPLRFPHHHPQLGLQHLAIIVLRQCVEKDVTLRPLEACDRGEAMRVEF